MGDHMKSLEQNKDLIQANLKIEGILQNSMNPVVRDTRDNRLKVF